MFSFSFLVVNKLLFIVCISAKIQIVYKIYIKRLFHKKLDVVVSAYRIHAIQYNMHNISAHVLESQQTVKESERLLH